MKRRLTLLSLLFATQYSSAEISVSGFGSAVLGTVVKGDGYIAEYPNLGVYDDNFDFGQETKLGIQARAPIQQDLNLTLQMMTRGANEWEPQLEWMYLTYFFNDSVDIQVGRLRMPVYKYSEFMDVGFAYPWVRVPADTYSLDVVNYNGLRVNYLTGSESIPIRLSTYLGREKEENSELMSYLFGGDVDRDFKQIIGLVADGSYDFLNLRLSYTEAELDDLLDGVGDTKDISFFDAAFTLSFGNLSILAEYNEYKPFYSSYFGSLNYQHNLNTYYLLWSKFDLDKPFEEHDTTSIGVRHNIGDNVALKFDLSFFADDGFNPFTGQPNPVFHNDDDGEGDSTILTIALDFVF